MAAWAVLLAGASIWELTALFLQPSFSTDSYAHPTLSYLANPVVAWWAWLGLHLFSR